MADAEDDGASLGVWIGLSVIAAVSFYFQAALTEERFVPALNVVAIEFNIPDDVAGATLMAAGASSPELFSSIVSLFITHSALGLGTIVGSEIFNQLVICAGAVYAAKSGNLKLDRAIVTREVGFYALSIAGLLYALRDHRPAHDGGSDYIFIQFSDAAILAGGYVLYVLVCAYFEPILQFLVKKRDGPQRGFGADCGAIQKSKVVAMKGLEMPFMHKSFIHEPLSNFELDDSIRMKREARRGSFLGHRLSSNVDGDTVSLHPFRLEVHTERPSDLHAIYEFQVNEYSGTLSCFLWQRSYFYTKAKTNVNGWYLSWFTFTHDSVYSVPDRTESEMHRMTYPRFMEVDVDLDRLILRIPNPKEGKRDYYWMAPSKDIFAAVVKKCEAIMEVREAEHTEATSLSSDAQPVEEVTTDAGPHAPLTKFPWEGSLSEITFHILLFPIKALMQYTIPDVRHMESEGNPKGGLGTAFLAIFMCLVWLVVGSYAMVASLEELAKLMNIPDAVIGVTVSAAGTSLPNYVASKVAAERGFGNMAVSNVFGSNTFNIMVGLGWPWLLYIMFANDFQPYHGLRNDGILESVVILAAVLIVFVVIVLISDFTLYRWHGILFIVLYVAYLAFAIGQVYL